MKNTGIPSQSKYISGFESLLITANKQTRQQTNSFWPQFRGKYKEHLEHRSFFLDSNHPKGELKGKNIYILSEGWFGLKC